MKATTATSYSSLPNNTHEQWWRDPGMRTGMFHMVILYAAVYSLGYDGSLLNGLQALTPWGRDFNRPAGYDLGLISASYYLPKIPSVFILAWIADRFGRKAPIYLGSVFMLAGALLGGFCNSRTQLIGSRILLGIGTASAQLGAASLVPELAHPRLRHLAGAFLNPTIGVWFVPQSPRWLVRNKRIEEAHLILATYHANGKMDDPLVLMELKEIEAAVVTEELANTGSWLTFFKTPGGRRRLGIIIMIGTATQWAGNGIISYYLVPVLKQVGIVMPAQTAGINEALAISNFFFAIAGALNVERVGRRPLFLASLAGMIVFMSIMCGVSGGYAKTHHAATGIAIVPFIFAFMAAYSMALTPLPSLYVPETSPLALRAKSLALLSFSQNVAQAFNQFANPIALKAITWKYYIVYICVLCFYLVAFYFTIRETRGCTVEEAAVVYDSANHREAALASERKIRQAAEASLDDKAMNVGEHSEYASNKA
ncbi:hypothetical protein RQP46_009682 [Phenoliferia psychrophenolica]